jgi:hypothetical protein
MTPNHGTIRRYLGTGPDDRCRCAPCVAMVRHVVIVGEARRAKRRGR